MSNHLNHLTSIFSFGKVFYKFLFRDSDQAVNCQCLSSLIQYIDFFDITYQNQYLIN